MILELAAKTSVEDLTIEFIQATTKQGENISLNWETSYVTRDSKGFSARYVAVCFGEDYANGKLETLRDMTIDVIELYSETEGKLDIEITEMIFYDGGSELKLQDVYKTDDNEAYMAFKEKFEKFVREQVGQGYKNELRAFSENEDDSGLYDIAYDMKWSVLSNDFDPFDWEEKTFESFGRAYDNWYDCFIESDKDYLLESYDDTILPNRVEKAGKASYVERNQEMINASDFCVFYYNPSYLPPKRKNSKRDINEYQPKSGTRLAWEYASHRRRDGNGITIINLYES